jgi:hypothetical protein
MAGEVYDAAAYGTGPKELADRVITARNRAKPQYLLKRFHFDRNFWKATVPVMGCDDD